MKGAQQYLLDFAAVVEPEGGVDAPGAKSRKGRALTSYGDSAPKDHVFPLFGRTWGRVVNSSR